MTVLGPIVVNICADEKNEPPTGNADFYVASDGKDSNPALQPPRSPQLRARDAVRAKVATGLTCDVLVLIRGGVYPQMGTLTFDSKGSGTDKYSITYAAAPGNQVICSGGKPITAWRRGAGEVWTTELPEVKAGKWYFRQLFTRIP
jgi:hypothetical protein